MQLVFGLSIVGGALLAGQAESVKLTTPACPSQETFHDESEGELLLAQVGL